MELVSGAGKRVCRRKDMFLGNDACRVGKWLARVLCIVLVAACLAGCGAEDERAPGETAKPFRVVATVFPAYDWTREILGEHGGDVELTLLLDGGVDMHSYQPTADDIIRIATCDMFIYVGGESDQWVEKVLSAAVNPDMVVINLLDVLGDDVKEEELVEGMDAGHGHEGHAEEDGVQAEDWTHLAEGIFAKGEEGSEMDEHVWLSVKNAEVLCSHIASLLAAANPAHAVEYEENAKAYLARLKALDAAFRNTVEEGEKNVLLFADRFPFRYLTDDYGLEYFAAFPGCEAETEASFETVAFLAGKVDELELPCVLTLDGSDGRIARTVISGTKAKDQGILTMDSMQSVTWEDTENGATYLSIMEENRRVLEAALSK